MLITWTPLFYLMNKNTNNIDNIDNIDNIIQHSKNIKEIGKGNYGKVYLISLKRKSSWCKYYCNF